MAHDIVLNTIFIPDCFESHVNEKSILVVILVSKFIIGVMHYSRNLNNNN
jgi:hypothetical protein